MKTATSSGQLTYFIYQSTLGPFLLVGSESGLCRVAFENENFDRTLEELTKLSGSAPVLDASAFTDVVQQLDEYFVGERKSFDVQLALPDADNGSVPLGFVQRGQQALADIPYGETVTYKELATVLGSPGASRAAGSACSTNPLPIFLPCHRVLPSDGKIGSYRGGPTMKQALLRLEGLEVDIKA